MLKSVVLLNIFVETVIYFVFQDSLINIKLKRTSIILNLRASFTKQGKLARERISKTALMGVELSVSDLVTMHKLNNTDITSHLNIDTKA